MYSRQTEDGQLSVAAAGVGWRTGNVGDVEWERHLHRVRPVVASAPRQQHDQRKATTRDDDPLASALATVADPTATAAGNGRLLVHDRRFVDDVVAALESRVLCELERRGGRFKEHR